MAANATPKVAVDNLGPEHLEAFDKTLRRIMSTDHVNHTLAQIVDGLPTREVYFNSGHGYSSNEIYDHVELNPESVDLIRAFQENFRSDALFVDSKLAQAYQDTPIGSRQFHLRLLEMAATAFHTIVALLFDNTNSPPYKNESSNEPAEALTSEINRDPSLVPLPTFFHHTFYTDYDQYPLGVADMVGYWAEHQVFGGVVLFDRGESDEECHDAFLHPVAFYMIFKLSETQLNQFIDFALHDRNHDPSTDVVPLPFRAEKWTRRIEPEDSMAMHIFRNRYERKPPKVDPIHTTHRRRRLEDFPDVMDYMAKMNKPKNQE